MINPKNMDADEAALDTGSSMSMSAFLSRALGEVSDEEASETEAEQPKEVVTADPSLPLAAAASVLPSALDLDTLGDASFLTVPVPGAGSLSVAVPEEHFECTRDVAFGDVALLTGLPAGSEAVALGDASGARTKVLRIERADLDHWLGSNPRAEAALRRAWARLTALGATRRAHGAPSSSRADGLFPRRGLALARAPAA